MEKMQNHEDLLKGLSPEEQERVKADAKAMFEEKMSALGRAFKCVESGDFTGLVGVVASDSSVIRGRDDQMRTLLHVACLQGNKLDMAKYLVERGASLEAKDAQNRSMLHVAAYGNQVKVAEWLIIKGLDLNAADTTNSTPLHWASKKGNSEMVALLVDKGADIEAKTVRDRKENKRKKERKRERERERENSDVIAQNFYSKERRMDCSSFGLPGATHRYCKAFGQ